MLKPKINEEYVHIDSQPWMPFPAQFSQGGIRWKLLHVSPEIGSWIPDWQPRTPATGDPVAAEQVSTDAATPFTPPADDQNRAIVFRADRVSALFGCLDHRRRYGCARLHARRTGSLNGIYSAINQDAQTVIAMASTVNTLLPSRRCRALASAELR